MQKIKILIVNTSDIQGGAARAAYRLHRSLLAQNIDSQMLVQDKTSDDWTITAATTKLQKGLNKLRPTLDELPVRLYKNKTSALFSLSWLPFSRVAEKINKINPDIVHLHWIANGMMRIEDIAKIKAPIVWSLHDMWAFTGGCHYAEDCSLYEKKCGNCPVLKSNKTHDLSSKIYQRKQKTFAQNTDLTIVSLSRWLKHCAKNSTLLRDKKHINLPNPIDSNVFKPSDKEMARELWGLPKDKKLILFGATSVTSDARKGFKYLNEALQQLSSTDIELVVFGSGQPKNTQNFDFKTHYLGHLYDDISLVTLYNAVNVSIVPSLQENLSNTIMESLACATPVVGFDIGGNSDMIEHKKTGYLAKPLEVNDLARGIEWILNNKNEDYLRLSFNARDKVLKEFDSTMVVKKYIKLYENILNS